LEYIYDKMCASCWSPSRVCITMYGSENVKFTVVVNFLEVGSVVVIVNFTASESYVISDRY